MADSERRRAARLLRESQAGREHRLTLDTGDRPTLLPCPACGGAGKVELRVPGTSRYRQRRCAWCVGFGAVDHMVIRKWNRWAGIRRSAKECPG